MLSGSVGFWWCAGVEEGGEGVCEGLGVQGPHDGWSTSTTRAIWGHDLGFGQEFESSEDGVFAYADVLGEFGGGGVAAALCQFVQDCHGHSVHSERVGSHRDLGGEVGHGEFGHRPIVAHLQGCR